MRKFISILAFALVASAPAWAQQKSSASDRAMAREVALQKQISDLFNKKDAAGLGALYTASGVFADPSGKVAKGNAEITAVEAATIKGWGDYTFSSVVEQAGSVGSGIWGLVDVTVNVKGPNGPITVRSHVLNIAVPAGKAWKIAATSIGANVPPPGMSPPR